MHKRILIAETADNIRTVAESVLRQNGFEVIAVASSAKAVEVLKMATPDLLLIGAELQSADGRPLYEYVQSDPKSANLPMLLFDSASSSGLPFPDEVIIPRPFDPAEFVHRVQIFSGQASSAPAPARTSGKPTENSLDDEFLDSALGLDDISVTESEVMNRTASMRVSKGARSNNQIGVEAE